MSLLLMSLQGGTLSGIDQQLIRAAPTVSSPRSILTWPIQNPAAGQWARGAALPGPIDAQDAQAARQCGIMEQQREVAVAA